MKTSILVSLASFALVAAGHIAAVRATPLQSAQHAPRTFVSPQSTLTDGPQAAALLRVARASRPIDLGSVPMGTIFGEVPHAARSTRLVWTCGRVELNLVGGSQRTCEWVGR